MKIVDTALPTRKPTVRDYIEGAFNDYDNGETEKDEAINAILRLIVKLLEKQDERLQRNKNC